MVFYHLPDKLQLCRHSNDHLNWQDSYQNCMSLRIHYWTNHSKIRSRGAHQKGWDSVSVFGDRLPHCWFWSFHEIRWQWQYRTYPDWSFTLHTDRLIFKVNFFRNGKLTRKHTLPNVLEVCINLCRSICNSTLYVYNYTPLTTKSVQK